MNLSLEAIISLISAIGFGGILGAYLQFRFQHEKEVKDDIHQLKRQRYGAIIIQMLTILDSAYGVPKTQQFRPDLKSIEDFKEEVKIEMLNGILYASDEVIKAMAEFINNSTYSSYIKTASAMRRDLWNRKTKIGEDILQVFASHFKIIDLGSIFNDLDELIVRWLVALAMATNDLSLNLKLTREYGDQAEAHYFFRVSFAHLREIAKVVGESKGNEIIKRFLDNLDTETQGVYQDVVQSLGKFSDGSVTKSILFPVRNECFHYPDINGKEESFKDLPKILRSLDKKEVRFSETDKSILGSRYLFVDATVGFMVNSRLSKEAVDQISHIVIKLIQFVDHSLEYLKRLKS